uniref:Myotrophin n=1 Tax=Caligus clemensi TaxID=344056 RepID=C1C196_CALCM|nr:Myotrophin [Caligus clemensi]
MNDDLVWAIKNGDLDKVKEIIKEKGADVNEPIDGRQPCHFAADYGQLDVLRYLISQGGNVEGKDKHGISVLLAAIWEGHTSCVKFLIEKGSSKSGCAPDGTPYLNAAEKDEIKALLR